MEISIIVPVYNNDKFLRTTLQSIQEQGFKDFEVIVVNDGSTDSSEAIIDDFVNHDRRFKKICQTNQGVSAARNAGIAEAQGKYIGFADGDDLLPKNALQFMSNVSRNSHADLIIGGIQRIDGFSLNINKRTKKLNSKRKLFKDDIDLVHGMSLCNKWFLRKTIEAQQIRMEGFRHLEDGVFLYRFLQYAQNIHTCPEIVYTYYKRLPILGYSVTQRIEKGLLEDAIRAYQRIEELTLQYSREFHQELAYRILNTTLIGDYYRKIWQLDDSSATYLLKSMRLLWNIIKEGHKTRILKMGEDLWLHEGLREKKDIIRRPLVSFIIIDETPKEHIPILLQSIYGQATSNFSILMEDSLKNSVPEQYKDMPNLMFKNSKGSRRIFLNQAVNEVLGELLVIVDCECIFEEDLLKEAYRVILEESVDCVSMKPMVLNGQKKEVFDLTNRQSYFLANKIIQRSSLLPSGFQFEDDTKANIKRIECQLTCKDQKEPNLLFIRKPKEKPPKEKTSLLRRLSRKIKRIIAGKSSKVQTKPEPKKSILDYYFNEPIQNNSILLEGLGKRVKGNMLYLIQELQRVEYAQFQIYLVVSKATIAETRSCFKQKDINGVELVLANSDAYRRLLSTAQYLVNEVYFPNYWIKKDEQTYINIWHGTPLKKLGAAKAGGTIHGDGTAQKNFISADFILFPNTFTREHLLKDCYVDELVQGKALMLGYPRTGAMLNPVTREKIRKQLAPLDEQIIAYMPTYRGESEQQTAQILSLLKELDEGLLETQIVYVNLHHKMNTGINYGLYQRIRKFPNCFDTYEVLCAADCLCTDYSSLLFDFAVTGKKIVLHCPDLEEYIATRGLYLQMDALPFPKTRNSSQLLYEMTMPKNYNDEKFLKMYCSYDSKHNAQQFCKSMFLQKTEQVLIEEYDLEQKKNVLIYSDGWDPGAATDMMYQLSEVSKNKDQIYLSYKDTYVNQYLDSAYPLLNQFRSIGTKGKQLFTGEQKKIYRAYRNGELSFQDIMGSLERAYKTEMTRLYDKARFSGIIIYDTIEPDKVIGFSYFGGRKCLFLQELMIDALEEGNQYLLDAITYFSEQGNELFTLTEQLKEKGEKYVQSDIKVLKSVLELNGLIEAILNE